MMSTSNFRWIVLGGFAVCVAGCDAPIARFPGNDVYALVATKREASNDVISLDNINAAVEKLFGTPDTPRVPDALNSLVDESAISRTAGPQYSDQLNTHFGLFREHCATCHGVDGSGHGPAAALLTPYPRDFRPGVFKFRSTRRSDPPTREDLLTILDRGIPGTAMPSFATVHEEDKDALIQYVIYLSVRGQVERSLIDLVSTQEIDEVELNNTAETLVAEIAGDWLAADSHVVNVPPAPQSPGGEGWWTDADLIAKGNELFHGPVANCASCHGPGGDGNATTLDFDDWTKEYTTKLGITPSDKAAMKRFKAAGALSPRQSLPRKLQWGVFHGNDSDDALYRRLVTGIAGSPMPGLLLKDENNAVGADPADVWALVAYIRSLGKR